jgi:hypothetical protein
VLNRLRERERICVCELVSDVTNLDDNDETIYKSKKQRERERERKRETEKTKLFYIQRK